MVTLKVSTGLFHFSFFKFEIGCPNYGSGFSHGNYRVLTSCVHVCAGACPGFLKGGVQYLLVP